MTVSHREYLRIDAARPPSGSSGYSMVPPDATRVVLPKDPCCRAEGPKGASFSNLQRNTECELPELTVDR